MRAKISTTGIWLWMAATCLCALTACDGDSNLLPASSGKPYEVLLVGDSDSILFRTLSADMPCLPQPEPLFDVAMAAGDQPGAMERLSRAIVIVETDSTQYTRTAIRYERNTYARPQLIIHVTTPSTEALRSAMGTCGSTLVSLLHSFENSAQTATLRQKHNPEAERLVRDSFGIDMLIPADMQKSKRGRNFLWLSNDAPSGMQSICIYRGTNRDSVMKVHIPGEYDGCYMQTVAGSARQHGEVTRGLWEMKGDAMGGPFVVRTISDTLRHSTVSIEAFVYAPETRKRNKLRQIEAALYTAKPAAPQSSRQSHQPH